MAHSVRIQLHGVLAERYGARHILEIASPAEAVRALSVLHPGFRRDVAEGQWHLVTGSLKRGQAVPYVDLARPLARSTRVLHILPAVEGSGRFGSLLLGAALIGATFLLPGVGIALGATVTTALYGVGGSLILQGISSLLSPQIKPETGKDRKSYSFGNAPALPGEGDPVPLVYGEAIVPCIPISVGIDTVDTSETNAPSSTARARILYLICAGEIEGLVAGEKSIYFNKTPLIDVNGSRNFEGVKSQFRTGTADQAPIDGFPGVEREIGVGVECKKNIPLARTIINENVTLARVTVQVPALYKQGKKGPKGTDLYYDIQTRANGGAWQTVIRKRFDNDKALSPFEFDSEIRRPGAGDWDLRIIKISDDTDDDDERKSQLVWARYTEIIEARLSYPGLALLALEYDAKKYGTNLPDVLVHIRGRKTQVPSNYDPVVRSYAGLWNGAFKQAWHSNPAWVMYDLLTDRTYGLGDRIGPDLVDKWALYDIGAYSDVMVPDGHGAQEPRYRFDGRFIDKTEAYRALQGLAASWRGTVWWGRGLVTFSIDRPADPVKIVTTANVIDGEINYSVAPITAEHSVARVTWQNPDALDEPTVEPVEDYPRMRRVGYEPADVALIGCRSRAQSRRMGRWLLDTEASEDEIITYKTGLDHADVRPGDVVMTGDKTWAGEAIGGRLLSVADRVVTLDRSVKILGGRTYSLFVTMPDGALAEQAVQTGAGETAALALAAALPAAPVRGATWILAASDLKPRLWRVTKVTRDDQNPLIREIVAQEHDPTKYARVELGITFDPDPVSRFPVGRLRPPTNLTARPMMVEQLGGGDRWGMTLSWSPANDARVTRYGVEVQTTEDPWRPAYEGSDLACDVLDLPRDLLANYRVRSLDSLGQTSEWAYLLGQTPASPRTDPPAPPSQVQAIGDVGEIRVVFTPDRSRSDFRATEVWVSKSDQFDAGWLLAATPDTWVIDTVPPLQRRWYWLRTVTYDQGPAAASAWVGPWAAESQQITNPDWIGKKILRESMFDDEILRPIKDVPIITRTMEQIRYDIALGLIDADLAQWQADETAAVYSLKIEKKVVDGLSAEASKRETLAAKVDGQIAAVVTDVRVAVDLANATATKVETMDAVVQANAAAIRTEETVRANADGALGQRIDTVQATANGAVASVQNEVTARINGDNALSQRVDTVQTTVNGHTASIQQTIQSLDGVRAQWNIKINNNGRITGLGLMSEPINGVPTTTAGFMVDRFVIASANGDATPFAIMQVGGVWTVGITNAVIGDLTVTGRTIGWEATVTARSDYKGSVRINATGQAGEGWDIISSISWQGQGRPITISMSADNFQGSGGYVSGGGGEDRPWVMTASRLKLRRTSPSGRDLINVTGSSVVNGAMTIVDASPPAGWCTYEVAVKGKNISIDGFSLVAFETVK